MSNAFKCDYCKRLKEGNSVGGLWYTKYLNHSSHLVELSLCEECLDTIKSEMKKL